MSDKNRAIDVPSPAWQLNTGVKTEDPGPSKEDKVALAMKLAEEARERAAAEKAKAEKVALAQKLVEEAQARAAAQKAEAMEKAKKAKATPKKKKMSAKEALAAAIAAEEGSEPAPKKAKKAKKAKAKAKKPAATKKVTKADPSAALKAALGDITVESGGTPIANPTVFTAVWSAHGSRARHDGDLQLAALAHTLTRAAGQGTVSAWRVVAQDTAWAVWTDESGEVIGAASPADLYLAGT